MLPMVAALPVGSPPAGFQPSGGFIVNIAPRITRIAKTQPYNLKTSLTPHPNPYKPFHPGVKSSGPNLKPVVSLTHISAPKPNPATAKPVIRPFLSGNHFTSAAIGHT